MALSFPVGRIAAKATHGTGLVVITPEQRIPAVMRLHPLLTCLEQLFQGKMVGRHQCPFVAVLVVHFQMMEVEAHGQFMVARSSVYTKPKIAPNTTRKEPEMPA